MKIDITNKDIYNKIVELEKHVIATNGKVKLNRWIATTAISLLTLWIATSLASAGAML